MELVQVEITGCVVTSRYGTLAAGDIVRTDQAFAKHLVDDCHAAKFVSVLAPGESPKVDSKKRK